MHKPNARVAEVLGELEHQSQPSPPLSYAAPTVREFWPAPWCCPAPHAQVHPCNLLESSYCWKTVRTPYAVPSAQVAFSTSGTCNCQLAASAQVYSWECPWNLTVLAACHISGHFEAEVSCETSCKRSIVITTWLIPQRRGCEGQHVCACRVLHRGESGVARCACGPSRRTC